KADVSGQGALSRLFDPQWTLPERIVSRRRAAQNSALRCAQIFELGLGGTIDNQHLLLVQAMPVADSPRRSSRKRKSFGARKPVKLPVSAIGSLIQKCGAPTMATVRTNWPVCFRAVTN